MSDGARRFACRNTYKVVDFHGDGTFTSREVIIIEFVLDTNANAVRGRRYRKTSEKQAATFLPR